MRATLRAAALLLLADCSVPLSGGKCTTDENCPSDQRCSSGTCVTCVPDAACSGNTSSCTDPTTLIECRTNSGTCQYAVRTNCAAQSMLCGTTSGTAACECAANSTATFFADSDSGSAINSLPYATGLPDPPQCRIKTLTQALAKAATYVGGPATVCATGWSSGQKIFSKAKGETFPLEVQPNVTLTTADSPPAPGNYLVVLDDAGASAAVNLHENSAIAGLVVQSTAGSGDGIALSCSASSPVPSITGVDVDGAGLLMNGIDVKGQCGAVIAGSSVSGAASAGVIVNSASSTIVTSVTGGTFGASATGMRIIQGSVTLSGNEVAGNTSASASGVGLQIGDATKDVNVVATGLVIHDNDDTGIIVKTTPASAVSVTGTIIRSNKARNPASQYGSAMNTRKAGGVILWGQSPATFTFQSNTVYGNNFDQIGVYESSGTWSLSGGTSPTACGVTSNTFTCRDVANAGYGVYSTGASVLAGYNYWENDPPVSQDVSANVNTAAACGASTITCP